MILLKITRGGTCTLRLLPPLLACFGRRPLLGWPEARPPNSGAEAAACVGVWRKGRGQWVGSSGNRPSVYLGEACRSWAKTKRRLQPAAGRGAACGAGPPLRITSVVGDRPQQAVKSRVAEDGRAKGCVWSTIGGPRKTPGVGGIVCRPRTAVSVTVDRSLGKRRRGAGSVLFDFSNLPVVVGPVPRRGWDEKRRAGA